MSKLYITGGQQKKGAIRKDEWHAYQKGLIVKINPESETVEKCLEYITPPDARPEEDPAILFKSGTCKNGKLYICTGTEIMIYELSNFKRIHYFSYPYFNDLHHVCPTPNESLLIANTGLDMVLEMSLEGAVLREWSVIGEKLWNRFSREIDYRKIATTKPHLSHPNYVFQLSNDIWVTRFEQRDAICLTNREKKIDIGIERPHDGVLYGSFIFFTTVDGHVIIVNHNNLKINEVVDLNKINNTDKPLGWCRGIAIDSGKVWVGFSRLRPTKIQENISWIKHGFKKISTSTYNTLPTRVACYDLVAKKLEKEINLEEYGLNSVFSIFLE